ncbi:MAG TPA: DedA family protein [Candidatus Baltobacteraceae bacterium]|nr:DedA family protein [Candidatus Baltobacteraceae bacterium]
MEHLHQVAVSLIDHYGYGGLYVVLLLGNVGAPVGAEIIMPLAGALTATGHLPFIWLTVVVAVLGEVSGGTIGYLVGRFGGRPLIDRYGCYVHLSHANLDRVHGFFERYGSFAIFICRFIPVIRGIVSIPAGLAEMNLAQFYLWYALGSAVFCGVLVWVGMALGRNLHTVLPFVH